MAIASHESITNNNDGSYNCECSSNVNAKLVYEGIKTHGEATGPQWKLVNDARGSTSPSNRQEIAETYIKGFLVDQTGTHPIDIEEPP
jgi:hypothetical protein